MLLCPPVLTEALRVELPAHGADAGLPRLPLLQPQVQLLLELHDVQAGAGHAGHLLHPQLLVLLPLPAPKKQREGGIWMGTAGRPSGAISAALPPVSPRRQDGVQQLLGLPALGGGRGSGGTGPGLRDGAGLRRCLRGPLQRAGLCGGTQSAVGPGRASGSSLRPQPCPRAPLTSGERFSLRRLTSIGGS